MSQNIYEPVIGLEIHAQLLTKSKLFCGDSIVFGDEPNTHISAISLAHPGTLPVLNEKVVELAVKLGLALGCKINRENYFARKNYFYPDLPKGYQISQHTVPICSGGHIPIIMDGEERQVKLNRIHIEEDAGKSVHDADPANTCIDLNRAGTPLVEIVTEPVISSADEAFECLSMIRKIVRHLKVCDGNMEEGSLRCDANISVRKKGEKTLGTKVEVKNLNSIRNVKRAINLETKRLINILESGGAVVQQTRSFDADSGTTEALRSKEEANDYRYFPDPDLPPVVISEGMYESVRQSLPQLPHVREREMSTQFGISEDATSIISDDEKLSCLFDEAIKSTKNPVVLANWLIGPVKSFLNENLHQDLNKLNSKKIVSLVELTAGGHVSFATAASRIFPEVLNSDEDAFAIAKRLNLIQTSNTSLLNDWIDDVLNRMPEKVIEYKKGKKNLVGMFAGEVKKISKGKADMKAVINIITEKLNK